MLWLLCFALLFQPTPAPTLRAVWLAATPRAPPLVSIAWLEKRLAKKEWYSTTPQEGKWTIKWTPVILCASSTHSQWSNYHNFTLTDEEYMESLQCRKMGLSWKDQIARYDVWNTDKYDVVFADVYPKYYKNLNWDIRAKCMPGMFTSPFLTRFYPCLPLEENVEDYWCNKLGIDCSKLPPFKKPRAQTMTPEQLAKEANDHGMPMVTPGGWSGWTQSFWKSGAQGKYVSTGMKDTAGFYKAWFKYLIDNGAKKLMLINAKNTKNRVETCAEVDPTQAEEFAMFDECVVADIGWHNNSNGNVYYSDWNNRYFPAWLKQKKPELGDQWKELLKESNCTAQEACWVICSAEEYPKNETWIHVDEMTACPSECHQWRCHDGRTSLYLGEELKRLQEKHQADVAIHMGRAGTNHMPNFDDTMAAIYDNDIYFSALGRSQVDRGNPAWRTEVVYPERYSFLFTARSGNYFAPGSEKVYDDRLNVVNLFPPEGDKTSMQVYYEDFWQFYWKRIQIEPKTMKDGTLQWWSIDDRFVNLYLAMWEQLYHLLIAFRKGCTKECNSEIMNNALHSVNSLAFFGRVSVNSTGYNQDLTRPVTQHKYQKTPVDYNNVIFPPEIQSKGDAFVYPMPVMIDRPCHPDCHVCTKPDLCDQLGELAILMVMSYIPASVVFMILFLILGNSWVYSNEKGIAFAFNVMSGTTSACSVLTIWHLKDHLIDFEKYIIIMLAIFGGIDGGWNFINLFFDIIEVGFYKEWQETSFMINCNSFFGPIMAAVDATNACLGMYVLFNSKLVYTPDSMTVIIDVIINCLEAMYFSFDTMDRILKCLDGTNENNEEKE
jgi:hypothetical protein